MYKQLIYKIARTLSFSTALFVFAIETYAATYYLSNNGNDANSCLLGSSACQTFAGVLAKTQSGDEIRIQQGTYTLAQSVNQEWINHPLTIKGGYNPEFTRRSTDASATVLTSNGRAGVARLLVLNSGQEDWLVIDGLTLTGLTNADNHYGALLSWDTGTWLELNNVRIVGNETAYATGGGAALSVNIAGDKIKISDSEFSNNISEQRLGGAIYVSAENAEVDITNSRFENNQSFLDGGAIYMAPGFKHLNITDSSFIGNRTTDTSSNVDGGAIFVQANSTPSEVNINYSYFANNSTNYVGGAISFEGGNATTSNLNANVSNSTFESNSAAHGGALMHWYFGTNSTNNLLKVTNSTFYDNQAPNYGGAMAVTFGGRADVAYSTFIANHSASGGAIRVDSNQSDLSLLANLIIANTDQNIVNNDATTTVVDKGYNIIGLSGLTNSVINSSGFSWLASSGASASTQAADLLDVNLTENGGAVKSFALHSNSELRDAIPNDGIPFYGVGQSEDYPFRSLADAHGALNANANYNAGIYYFDIGASYGVAPEFTVTQGGRAFSTYVNDEGYVLIASAGFGSDLATITVQTVSLTQGSDEKLQQTIVDAMNIEEQLEIDGDRWVKAAGVCNGSVTTTDGRGLPRSDYVNPSDPDQIGLVTDCDIGAFEFNNGYRYDCHEEDGQRFGTVSSGNIESGQASAEVKHCFGGDLLSASPGALLNNVGSIDRIILLCLASFFGYRRIMCN